MSQTVSKTWLFGVSLTDSKSMTLLFWEGVFAMTTKTVFCDTFRHPPWNSGKTVFFVFYPYLYTGTVTPTDTTVAKVVKRCQTVSKPPLKTAGRCLWLTVLTVLTFLSVLRIWSRILLAFWQENTEINIKTLILTGCPKTGNFRPWVRYSKHVCFTCHFRTTFRSLFDHFSVYFTTFRCFLTVLPKCQSNRGFNVSGCT